MKNLLVFLKKDKFNLVVAILSFVISTGLVFI